MPMFEPITLTYKGESKTIPANQVLRLISIIEQNFDPFAVNRCAIPPGATIALIYAPILSYFGFEKVDVEALAMEFTSDYKKGLEIVSFCVDLLEKLKPPKEITALAPVEEPEPEEANSDEKKTEEAAQ